jgi:hypothetical protein
MVNDTTPGPLGELVMFRVVPQLREREERPRRGWLGVALVFSSFANLTRGRREAFLFLV